MSSRSSVSSLQSLNHWCKPASSVQSILGPCTYCLFLFAILLKDCSKCIQCSSLVKLVQFTSDTMYEISICIKHLEVLLLTMLFTFPHFYKILCMCSL